MILENDILFENDILGEVANIEVNEEHKIVITVDITNDEKGKGNLKFYDPILFMFSMEGIAGIFMKDKYPTSGFLIEGGAIGIKGSGKIKLSFDIDKDYLDLIEKMRTNYIPITIKIKLAYQDMPNTKRCQILCKTYRLKEKKWIEIAFKLGYYNLWYILKKLKFFTLVRYIFIKVSIAAYPYLNLLEGK